MPICNEDVGARVRGPARDLRVAGAHAASCAHFDFFVLSDTQRSRHARRRSRRLACAVPRGRRLRSHLLSLAPPPDQAQERQHRRLLPPLGQALSLHDRARRRQRDERRLPHARSCSWSKRIPTPASSRRRRALPARHPVRAHPAVRHRRLRAAVHRRPALLAARRVALLGPQRDHPRRAVHAPLRARAPAGQAARSPARSCRTISSRPR